MYKGCHNVTVKVLRFAEGWDLEFLVQFRRFVVVILCPFQLQCFCIKIEQGKEPTPYPAKRLNHPIN